ncbi:hypothetical protein LZG04_24395 [Saccharothrix sp. S26]|uniref:hypothetical protein n=1 Tax=Saccharothrix sp. S26 TaxID=2907215 RepID=UPI001F22CD08|nr:hypothetical protein [Saccharothrix sp. S26]MCE6997915.1 hypothetical protein [Saccharothrix sp. S26]
MARRPVNARNPIGALPLALSLAVAYVAVAGAAGFLALDARTATPTTTVAAVVVPVITTTTATTTTAPSAAPTTTTELPPDLRRVDAPGGLSTAIPAGWAVGAGTVATTLVATDPADPRREIRLGGAPVTDPAVPLLDRITAAAVEREREPGHTRLALTGDRIRDFPAVRWDFEELVEGAPERVAVAYWETGGIEYVVYARGPAGEWAQTRSRLAALIDHARP